MTTHIITSDSGVLSMEGASAYDVFSFSPESFPSNEVSVVKLPTILDSCQWIYGDGDSDLVDCYVDDLETLDPFAPIKHVGSVSIQNTVLATPINEIVFTGIEFESDGDDATFVLGCNVNNIRFVRCKFSGYEKIFNVGDYTLGFVDFTECLLDETPIIDDDYSVQGSVLIDSCLLRPIESNKSLIVKSGAATIRDSVVRLPIAIQARELEATDSSFAGTLEYSNCVATISDCDFSSTASMRAYTSSTEISNSHFTTSEPLVFNGALTIFNTTFLNVEPTSDAIQVNSGEINIDDCVFTNAPPAAAQNVYAVNITDAPTVYNMTATITNCEFVDCPDEPIYPANRVVDTTGNIYRTTSRTPLDAPTNLNATNVDFHQVSVSWGVVLLATGYSVQYKGALDDSFIEVVVETNSVTLTGLRYGEEYTIRVKAIGDNTSRYDSSYSTTTIIVTKPIRLNPPTITSASSSDNSITYQWTFNDDVSLISGSGIYIALKNEDEPLSQSVLSASSGSQGGRKTYNSLIEQTEYRVGVKVIAKSFPYVDSEYVSFVIKTGSGSLTQLDAPEWLRVSLQSETYALVGYASVGNATSYSLEYKPVEEEEWTIISRTGASWQMINNLLPKRDYVFRVKAVGDGVSYFDSGYVYAYESTIWNRPLSAPEIVVEPHARRAVVSWIKITGAAGYVVAYKLATAANFTTATLGEDVVSYEMRNLTANATYVVKVMAKGDDDGLYVDSDYCDPVTFVAREPIPKLNAPSIDEIASTASTMTIRWIEDSRRVKNVVEFKLSSASSWSSPIEVDDDSIIITGLAESASYDIRVRSLGDGTTLDDSDYSDIETYQTTARVALAKPTIETTVDGDSVLVEVDASDAELVASYVIQRAVEDEGTLGEWTTETVVAPTSSYTFSNLTLGKRHAFRAYTVPLNASEYLNSPTSEIVYETLAKTLDAPSPEVVSASATIIEISWTAVDGALSYEIYLDGVQLDETTETNYLIADLAFETQYSIQLKSIGDGEVFLSSGLSTALVANTNSISELSDPTLNERATTTNSITVEWTIPTNASSVEICLYSDEELTNRIGRVEYGSTRDYYEFVNLKPGKMYYARGRARGDGVNYSNSPYSQVLEIATLENPLATPVISNAAFSRLTATIQWSAPESDVGFLFAYKKTSDSNWTTANVGTGASTTIEAEASAIEYQFRVKELGDGDVYNDSEWSEIATATSESIPQASAPTLTGSVVNSSQIRYVWSAESGATTLLLELSTSESFATIQKSLTLDASLAEKVVSGLTRNTTYYARVKVLATSDEKLESNYSDAISLTTEKERLQTPELTIVGYTQTTAKFRWTKVEEADEYAIFITSTARQAIPESFVGTTINAAKITYTRLELTPNTTYYVGFRARANDESDYLTSTWSPVQTFTTLDLIPLGEITSFVATPSDDSIVMSWTLVNNASGYKIGYKKETDEEYEYVEGTPPCEIENLEAGTTYDITIQTLGDGELYGDSPVYETSVTTTNPIQLDAPTIRWIKGLNGAIHYAFDLSEGASGYEAKLFDEDDEQVFTSLDLTPFVDATIKRDIGDLQNGSSYVLKLKSVGDGVNYRDSQWCASDAVEVRDTTVVNLEQADAPQPGAITTSRQGNAGKVEFQWTNVDETSLGVYIALYRGETLVDSYSEYDSAISSGLFAGLTLGTEYVVKLTAYGDGIQTRDSETVAYEPFTIESQATPSGGRTDKSQWPDDLQGYSIGKDGRLLLSFDKGATWQELTTTRDATVNFSTSPIDSSCRRSGVYKENLPIRNELSVAVELLLDMQDPVIVELERRSKLNIAMYIGAFTDSGNGPIFIGFFSDASRSEELESVVKISGTFNLSRFIEWKPSLWNPDGSLDETHPANTL